jgi:hypothetical protein
MDNGPFQEATSEYLNLELDKVCTILFVRWLYSGKLLDPCASPDDEEMFQVYIFADRTDILALRRAVITELAQGEMIGISYRSVILATDSLPPSSPLYQFTVEWYTKHWISSEAERNH